MRHHTMGLTRRETLAASVASAAALAGCGGLGLGGGFEFPDGDPTDEQKEIARTFVRRVHDGEYAAATEPFTSEMSDAMGPDSVESTWSESVGDLGAYEDISKWGLESRDDTDAVFARVQCANGYYDLQVTIRDDRIAGLYFKNKVSE